MLYLLISNRISNQAENLFMGFWAQLLQRAAAALMGSYVHSTMLRNTVCTLHAFLRGNICLIYSLGPNYTEQAMAPDSCAVS